MTHIHRTIVLAGLSLVLAGSLFAFAPEANANGCPPDWIRPGNVQTCADIPYPVMFANLVSFSGPDPASITAGQTLNLAGLLRNTTNVTTGEDPSYSTWTFQNRFQVALADQASIVENYTFNQVGPIPGYGSVVVNHVTSYTFPTAGTYYYRLCADTLVGAYPWNTIFETNEDDNCSTWTAITVSPPPMPDVTPTAASGSTSLAIGQTGSWSATVYNVGNASTGVNVPVAFAIDDAGGNRVTKFTTLSPIAAGGSAGASVTHAFSVPGTYNIIPCADVASPWNGTFTESNEGNNCGPAWLTITVHPVPTAAISLSPNSVAYGGSSTLSWSSTGATSCTSTGFSTGGATSGTRTVSATANTTYYVSCSGPGGTSPTMNATLTVGPQPFPDLTPGSAATYTVAYGQALTVSGTVYNGGNAATGASFNNMFVTNLNAQGTAWNTTVTAAPMSGNLAPGGSASFSYTFPANTWAAPGSYQYAYCVDVNAAWAGLIGESNENNNCVGGTVVVTIPDFTAVTGGNISATVSTAASLGGIVQNIGNGSSGTAVQNLVQVCDTNCATYNQLNAVNTVGAVAAGGSQSVAVVVTAPSSPGSYSYRLCANVNPAFNAFPITEGNTNNNCSAWSVFTVSGAADLTAGAITPTTATAGSARTLSATATNNGSAASGSFPMLFQVSQTGALVNSSYLAGIPAGGTGASSASYTFPSAGTYQVRACANNNTSWINIVTESNYGNNCGPWTDVIVAAAVPPSVSCTVDQQSVPVGGYVNYTATPANGATSPYTWTASDGASVGNASVATRTFTVPGNYAMTVKGSNTSAVSCPMVSVNATWCTTATPSLSITASPARVKAGQTSTISWSATGVNGQNASCTVSGPGVSWSSAVSAAPTCSVPSSSGTPTISTQSTYTLTCGSETKSVTVNVIPNFTEF